MSTKVKQLIADMESTNIFMKKEMTFIEYTENLHDFQGMITKMVMGEDYEEGMRLDEAIFRLEAKSRAKGLVTDQIVRKGLAALRTVKRELAITMAGKKGDNLVARTLQYVERPDAKMYQNLYVTDGENETEIDTVVLTASGIIILEIKNTKDDITITPEGRIFHSGVQCYDKKTIDEKMENKRKLLKERLQAMALERGFQIPIIVESFIVFSCPKGVRVHVEDRFRREKWCFRTGLVTKIDDYVGKASYSKEQLSQLEEMFNAMESQVKRFTLIVNFDDVRADVAHMLVHMDELYG